MTLYSTIWCSNWVPERERVRRSFDAAFGLAQDDSLEVAMFRGCRRFTSAEEISPRGSIAALVEMTSGGNGEQERDKGTDQPVIIPKERDS